MEMKHCSRTHRQGKWLSIDIDPPAFQRFRWPRLQHNVYQVFFEEVGAGGVPSGV